MRKILIKRYALDYMCKIYGYNLDMPRSLTVVGVVLLMISIALNLDFKTEKYFWIDILLTLLLGLNMFLSVLYFQFFPVKLKELEDMEQVYQFKIGLKRNSVVPHIESEEGLEKIFKAETFIKEEVLNKKFYKPYRIFYHPVVTLLVGGVITILYYYTKS